jgi:hypothetical protein
VSEPFDPEMSEPVPPEQFGDELNHVHVPWWIHWRPAMLAAVVFATVLGGVVVARGNTTSTPATTTTTTLPPGVCPDGSSITCIPLERVVRLGAKGEDVRRIQQRLKELKFDPGPIDGVYGGNTMMAVWAFQTLVVGMSRDTVVDFVTPVLWDSMRGEVNIEPRRQPGSPNHVEVYLPEQVMTVFKGTELQLVTHVSTGTGVTWCEEVTIDPGEEGNEKGIEPIKEGWCGESVTPGGIYYFYNRRIGLRESKLGTMWNPVYFNYGIAIHGAMTVPKEPASHGCVRIPIFISEYFPAMVQYNDRVYVFDGVKEPEEYGSQSPPWDRPDPNYTTTTSSTTTTTTIPPTTIPRTTVPRPTTPPDTTTTSTTTVVVSGDATQ